MVLRYFSIGNYGDTILIVSPSEWMLVDVQTKNPCRKEVPQGF